MILICNRMCTGKSHDGRLMQLKPGDHIQVVKKVKQGWLVIKEDVSLIVSKDVIKNSKVIR